jgi:NAD(P)-dependent dehydrogenase (short-subunit alcohol dehydrogenase family)
LSRTIIVTGATGKLGRVYVSYFLKAGDSVIAIGRSEERLSQLSSLCKHDFERLHLIQANLLDEGIGKSIADDLVRLKLSPDCLINNARNIDFLRLNKHGFVSRDNFLNEFTLNVAVPYELTMTLAIHCEIKLRSVVNIGSIYGSLAPNLKLYSNPEQQSPIQYGVTKAALAHLTKELAVRLAPREIRVNCVAYGGVKGRVDEDFEQRYAQLCPAGRMLEENEIAGPVDMLLSNSASGITGHVLMVDGGWSVW